MGPSTIAELVGLAIACGAADAGGPLSRSEAAQARRSVPASAGAARRARAELRAGGDPLGIAFCSIRSPRERRQLGAYYTNDAILQPMIAWALDQRPSRLIDPGCGSGRYALAALARDPALEVVAVDLDPVATLLTRAGLACAGAKRARVLHADYLTVRIPSVAGRTAFVGNPPYVRHHELSAATKRHASALAAKVGRTVSGLAGLHALFYLATLAKHGHAGDVGTFVTSAEWLDVGYGSIVRSLFTDGLGGRSLLVLEPSAVPFDDAMTTAAITTFRIGEEPAVTRLGRAADVHALRGLEESGREVDRALLERSARWSPYLFGLDEHVAGGTIGDAFRVSRGQVTGANGYFVMSRADARRRAIERYCVPVVCSAEEILHAGGIVRDGPERMVGLEVPKELDLQRHRALAAYVRAGEARGVNSGYIASRRRPWYAVKFPRPPIIATYMARQAPVFARNPDGLGLLNVAHGLHPRQPLDDAALTRIVAILNHNRRDFVGRGRTYHGGLEKFEPREMEALPLEVPA